MLSPLGRDHSTGDRGITEAATGPAIGLLGLWWQRNIERMLNGL